MREEAYLDSVSIPYLIKQLELTLGPRFNAVCASVGMTPAQFTAVTVLRRRPGITSSELARRSFVRAQTMAATVKPMLDSKIIRREKDPLHGRRILLYLTEHGEMIADQISGPLDALEDIILDGFSDREKLEFTEYLRRARNSMSAVLRDGTENTRPTA